MTRGFGLSIGLKNLDEKSKDKIVELYTKFGMSQEAIGRRIGTSGATISKVLQERNVPIKRTRRF